MNRTKNSSELEEFLYDCCLKDRDLMATVISEYVYQMSMQEGKLDQLEDFLTNNFGED